MKIVKDCWEKLGVSECQYGAHVFNGVDVVVYVNHWLAAFAGLDQLFSRKNSEGFVGHCQLVFREVERFDLTVEPYCLEAGKVIWLDPVKFQYSGKPQRGSSIFQLAGSLHGFFASVDISVVAREFELHVLAENEPARQA
jgi:hypothetical protein